MACFKIKWHCPESSYLLGSFVFHAFMHLEEAILLSFSS